METFNSMFVTGQVPAWTLALENTEVGELENDSNKVLELLRVPNDSTPT